jgi:peptidoglycan/LPS O-acetylase OafA/YrhL
MAYSPLDWLNTVLLTKAFDGTGNGIDLQSKFNSINSVYWSLAIEVQFYFVMWFALVTRSRSSLVLIIVSVASLLSQLFPRLTATGIFLPYWAMFAVGLMLCLILDRGLTPRRLFGRAHPWLTPAAGLAFVGGLACWLLTSKTVTHVGFAVAVFPLFWILSAFEQPFTSLLASDRNRFLRAGASLLLLLGAMSYSIYLVHTKLMAVVSQVVGQLVAYGSLAHTVLGLLLTPVVCYPFYRFCERPFIQPSGSPTRSNQKCPR